MAQTVKNMLAMQKTWVRSLSQEDPLQKVTATHSSILAWRIPMDRRTWWAIVSGVARVGQDCSDLAHSTHGDFCHAEKILISIAKFYCF